MPKIGSIPAKLKRYAMDSYQEMKKVVWPSKQETIQHTIVVIVFSLFVAALLGLLDLAFSYGLQKLLAIK